MAKVLLFKTEQTRSLCHKYDKMANQWSKYIPDSYNWAEWSIGHYCKTVPSEIVYRNLDMIPTLSEKNGFHYCLFASPTSEMLISRVWNPADSRAHYNYVVNVQEIMEVYPEAYVQCLKQGVIDYLARNFLTAYTKLTK